MIQSNKPISIRKYNNDTVQTKDKYVNTKKTVTKNSFLEINILQTEKIKELISSSIKRSIIIAESTNHKLQIAY